MKLLTIVLAVFLLDREKTVDMYREESQKEVPLLNRQKEEIESLKMSFIENYGNQEAIENLVQTSKEYGRCLAHEKSMEDWNYALSWMKKIYNNDRHLWKRTMETLEQQLDENKRLVFSTRHPSH